MIELEFVDRNSKPIDRITKAGYRKFFLTLLFVGLLLPNQVNIAAAHPLPSQQLSEEKERKWTSSDGRSILASLIEIKMEGVVLRRASGKVVYVRYQQLSAEDRSYVENLNKPTEVKPSDSIKDPEPDHEASLKDWLGEGEKEFFKAFPVTYQIKNKKFVRRVDFERIKLAAKLTTGKSKELILDVLGAEEISRNAKHSEKIAKLYRDGTDVLLRYKVLESVVVNDSPFSAAYDITRSFGNSGILKSAWQSKKEAYIAKLTATRLAQVSTGKIVDRLTEKSDSTPQSVGSKLIVGEECIQLELNFSAATKNPIVVLKCKKKQTENWRDINGAFTLFEWATGLIDKETAIEGAELAAIEQEFWNQELMLVFMPRFAPSDARCLVDIPVLNDKLLGLESVVCEIATANGKATQRIEIESVKRKLQTLISKGERYSRSFTDRDHSDQPTFKPEYKGIYPGAIWRGFYKTTGFGELEVPDFAWFYIDSFDEGKFTGLVYHELKTTRVVGEIDSKKQMRLSGRIAGNSKNDFEGKLKGNKISLKRSFVPVQNNSFHSRQQRYRDSQLKGRGKKPDGHFQHLDLEFLKPKKSGVSKIQQIVLDD